MPVAVPSPTLCVACDTDPACSPATTIHEALSRLAITPMVNEDVWKYQAKAARAATPLWSRFVKAWYPPCILSVLIGILICSYLCSVWYSPVWSLLLLSEGVVIPLIMFIENHIRIPVASWRIFDLSEYQADMVPAQVRQTIVRIRGEFPAATFTIEELRLGNEVLDPFLRVSDGRYKFYVEQWG